MLGEQIGEERGQVTTRRVLPAENGAPRVEISFESAGTLLGVGYTHMGTYVAGVRPDGNLAGEGNGVAMTPQGDLATWKGQGVGRIGPNGTASWRGAIYFLSTSPAFARLNDVATIYEYEVDESGKTQATFWEWK